MLRNQTASVADRDQLNLFGLTVIEGIKQRAFEQHPSVIVRVRRAVFVFKPQTPVCQFRGLIRQAGPRDNVDHLHVIKISIRPVG